MKTPSPFVVGRNRREMALLCLGALAFVALGVWLLSVDLSELSGEDPLTVRGTGLASLLFFGACFLVGIRQALSLGAALELDQEGVLDRVSVVRAGRIPWSAIEGFGSCWIAGKLWLVIRVRDPEQYVRRAWPWMRPIHRHNIRVCGSPVVAAADFLNIRFDDLLTACEAFRERSVASTEGRAE